MEFKSRVLLVFRFYDTRMVLSAIKQSWLWASLFSNIFRGYKNKITWRLFYPPAHEPGGSVICGFIDCTIYAFCRPGGVTGDGPAAFRVPQEVQEAWWAGWKNSIVSNGKVLF